MRNVTSNQVLTRWLTCYQNVLGRVTSNLYEISDEGLVNTNARQGIEHCVQTTELKKLSGTICGIIADSQQNIRHSHNLRLPLSVNTLNDKGSHTLPIHQIYFVDCQQTCPHSFQMSLPVTSSSAFIMSTFISDESASHFIISLNHSIRSGWSCRHQPMCPNHWLMVCSKHKLL